ncbi:unnamed protein product [Paramecium pentaurelia]|uniref:Protein kinase domain-containing protein n=1 Tax=Paramecium pentaurelia TaxID=43138 RepID=A0A8S1U884_9CILI|nr:unnamed protein product [Paramecium pentaurelia]
MNQYKIVGDYQIYLNQKLGSGAMSEVYVGERKTDKLKVAVKIISKQYINSRDQHNKQIIKKRIKREITIQSSLKHPNILELFNVQETQNSIYLFMELAHSTLDQYYTKKIVNQEEMKKIITQIVNAFLYMSEIQIINHLQNDKVYKGVCHLDLKPQNILIVGDTIKISDFGLSTSLQQDENQEMHESLDQIDNIPSNIDYLGQGSLLYMSIEQLNYQPTQNLQILDVWSAGIIFYELAFGKHPYYQFDSNIKTPIQLLSLLNQAEFTYPESQFDKQFYDLLQGMLKKNHKERLTWKQCKEHPFLQ